jgi:hypothetical protein
VQLRSQRLGSCSLLCTPPFLARSVANSKMLPPTFDLSSLPFSDRHTILGPDGKRYRFERIPDQNDATNTVLLSAAPNDPETVDTASQQGNRAPPTSNDRHRLGSTSNSQQLSHGSVTQTNSISPRGTGTILPLLDFTTPTNVSGLTSAISPVSLLFPSDQRPGLLDNLQTIWEPAPAAESSTVNRYQLSSSTATQPSSSENAVPTLSQQPSESRLDGHPNARVIPITGPPPIDGLMTVLTGSGTSGSSTSGQIISGESLVFER